MVKEGDRLPKRNFLGYEIKKKDFYQHFKSIPYLWFAGTMHNRLVSMHLKLKYMYTYRLDHIHKTTVISRNFVYLSFQWGTTYLYFLDSLKLLKHIHLYTTCKT